MYLIDTNVINESRKGKKANAGVIAFWTLLGSSRCYLSVQTMGELRRGLENVKRRGDTAQAFVLATWLERVEVEYCDSILNFDQEAAQVWGKLMSPSHHNPIEKQIAAIGLMHGLTVVTRNVKDFADTGVTLLNPFI